VRKAATGRKVTVAVVDSGIESNHPDLAGQVAVEENFVDGQKYVAELHGTAVAGVIAARAGNGVGIEGVAPDARLLALRACWQAGSATRCNSFTLAKAINLRC
jgi:subtilisin family serine protease